MPMTRPLALWTSRRRIRLGAAAPDRSGGQLLILCATEDLGGCERAVQVLSGALARRGIGVTTVFPQTANAAKLLDWCRRSGVEAATSTSMRSVYQSHSLRDMLRFHELVRRSSAAVVSLHYGGQHISFKDVLFTRLAGKRCVVQPHHAVDILDVHKRRMTRLAVRLAHAVVVATPAMRDVLVQAGVAADRIHLIPYGLIPPDVPLTRSKAREHLGLPDDAFVVGSVGRLSPDKGFDSLIEAVAMLADPRNSLRLVIAGDGPERSRLVSLGQARLGDRFCSLGWLEHLDNLYAAADVFALASQEEGFGLVFVEAAFHGVPAVGIDVGGIPYAICHEKTGLLTPAGDLGQFSAAIDRLRGDDLLRHQLGTSARARALSDFSVDLMAARYLAILQPGR
jgi:glycosyltransferase involved in cell wall biosynthesis